MKNKYAPVWAVKPFAKMIKQNDKLHYSFSIIRYGYHASTNLPNIAKIIKEVKPDELIDHDQVNEISDKALEEINSGFPFIYSNATILVWSYLESAIRQFIFSLLKNDTRFMEIEEIRKIKISIADYNNLNEDERIHYLIEQYEKNITNGINYSVERFEALLKPFGFSGKVPSKITKNILELAQVRNLILHKGGIFDLFIKTKCPWLNYKVGDEVVIDSKSFKIYSKAVHDYVVIIIHRIGIFWGAEMGEIDRYIVNE